MFEPVGIFTTGSPTTGDTPTIESLAASSRAMLDECERLDAGMVGGLNAYIRGSGEPLTAWAARLRVDPAALLDVLRGRRRPSWYFWDQVRRVFEPLRTADRPFVTTRGGTR